MIVTAQRTDAGGGTTTKVATCERLTRTFQSPQLVALSQCSAQRPALIAPADAQLRLFQVQSLLEQADDVVHPADTGQATSVTMPAMARLLRHASGAANDIGRGCCDQTHNSLNVCRFGHCRRDKSGHTSGQSARELAAVAASLQQLRAMQHRHAARPELQRLGAPEAILLHVDLCPPRGCNSRPLQSAERCASSLQRCQAG